MMVFVKFNSLSRKRIFYFVGASIEDVLADVRGFDLTPDEIKNHKIISEKMARSLNLGYLERGIADIKDGTTKSFMLRSPR